MTELDERAEAVLKSNIEILYAQLTSSIQDFLDSENLMGDVRYINAYLSATLNAIISYMERLISVGRLSETETVQALKFANNLQKHNPQLISVSKPVQGFTLPFCLKDGFSLSEVHVVWDDCIGLETRSQSQRKAYEKCFMKKSVTYTLEPIVRELLDVEKL